MRLLGIEGNPYVLRETSFGDSPKAEIDGPLTIDSGAIYGLMRALASSEPAGRMSEWQRYSAVEYSRPGPLAEEISTRSRIPLSRAKDLLRDSGRACSPSSPARSEPRLLDGRPGAVSECRWDSARSTSA